MESRAKVVANVHLLGLLCGLIISHFVNLIVCLHAQVTWPAATRLEHKLFQAVFELVVGFLLPVCVMAVCYTRLLLELLRSAKLTSGK